MRRTIASPTARSVAGLLVLVACGWSMATGVDARALPWIGMTALAVAGGCVALGWLRPAQIMITAPQAMLLLGTLGMIAGLALDARRGSYGALVSICTARPEQFVQTLRLHWQLLPAMHAGMIAGGLATVPLLRTLRRGCRRQFCARLTQNLACSAWMVAGMSAGTVLFSSLAAWAGERGAAAMLGGMFSGMVWGMVASVSLYRLWFWAGDRYGHKRLQ
jgi:hypothetical protein